MARRGSDMVKATRELLKLVDRTPGWSYQAGSHSWRVNPPDGTVIFLPKTPSDWRAVKNNRAALRRHGLDC